MAYSNLFAWMIILSKLLGSSDLEISNINTSDSMEQKIEKISQKIELDDVILNSDKTPYLWNFIKNAIDHQEKTHYIIYHTYLNESSIDKWTELLTSSNEKANSLVNKVKNWFMDFYQIGKKEQVQKFSHSLELRFAAFENHVNNALGANGLSRNIKFINIEYGIKSAEELYKKENLAHQQMCEKFNRTLRERLSRIYKQKYFFENRLFDRGNAIDALKILGLLSINDNVLLADFDITQHCNLDIPKDDMLKFIVLADKDFNQNILSYKETKIDSGGQNFCPACPGAFLYLAHNAKKIPLLILDLFLENINSNRKKFIFIEDMFYMFLSFIVEKNFHNSNELMHYIKHTPYDKMRFDFNEYYKYFIIKYRQNLKVLQKHFIDLHANDNNTKYFITDEGEQKIVIDSYGKTWYTNIENKKNNIFKQINNYIKKVL